VAGAANGFCNADFALCGSSIPKVFCDIFALRLISFYLFKSGNHAPTKTKRKLDMDKEFYQAEETNCNAFASQIEDTIENCRINNLGYLIFVMFDNASVASVYPLTKDLCDVFCKDCNDENYERKDLSIQDALIFLAQISSLPIQEDTSTGAVAGYDTSKAFAASGQKSNRAIEQSKREGWKTMNENEASDHPFGEDVLGRKSMSSSEKKTSEGKRKSAIAHNFEKGSPLALSESSGSNEINQTLSYLAEMLPADNAEIEGDTLTVAIDCVKIIITQQDDRNFSIQSYVDAEKVQESENLSTSDLIKWAFSICGQIQSRCAARNAENNLEISNDEIFSTLKELARESGMSDDILRNKDLFNLKKLSVPKSENSIHPKESVPAMESSSSVMGSNTHNGHPVSLNEARDASRPYADTLGGKKLVYLPGIGATFVDVNEITPQRKLNFDPVYGVVLTESSQPTNRKGMWKFRGYR
jgi:hypothetical protein